MSSRLTFSGSWKTPCKLLMICRRGPGNACSGSHAQCLLCTGDQSGCRLSGVWKSLWNEGCGPETAKSKKFWSNVLYCVPLAQQPRVRAAKLALPLPWHSSEDWGSGKQRWLHAYHCTGFYVEAGTWPTHSNSSRRLPWRTLGSLGFWASGREIKNIWHQYL